jgi:hypothetical protein
MPRPDTNTPDADPPPPQMVKLAQPRPLTPHERQLLEFVLASPHSRDQLREQLHTTRVVSDCDCGCPSIGLQSDGQPSRRH